MGTLWYLGMEHDYLRVNDHIVKCTHMGEGRLGKIQIRFKEAHYYCWLRLSFRGDL